MVSLSWGGFDSRCWGVMADVVAEFGQEKSESLAGEFGSNVRRGLEANTLQDCQTSKSRNELRRWSRRGYEALELQPLGSCTYINRDKVTGQKGHLRIP